MIRSRAAAAASTVIRPLSTERARELPIRARAAAAFSSVRAARTTSYPALANTSAMPEAMVPLPATPTERTGRAVPEAGPPAGGVSASRTTVALPGSS